MTHAAYPTFDFRSASIVDAAVQGLKCWLQTSSLSFEELWTACSGSKGSFRLEKLKTKSFEEALNGLANHSIGMPIFFSTVDAPAICLIDRADLLKIVHLFLGITHEDEPADRELTNVECNLGAFFIDTLANSLAEGWMGKDTPTSNSGDFEMSPKRSKTIGLKELVHNAKLIMSFEGFEIELNLLFPKENFDRWFEELSNKQVSESFNDPTEIVATIPIEVCCLLGESEISMNKLANLACGDILMLDQKIDEPLIAMIGDKEFLECWPGKTGNCQAIQITNLIGKSQ